jgi:peptide-methionine (R)-S-oxide reductase
MKTYNRNFEAVSPLTQEKCWIMQQDGKERPGRSEYWDNKEPGRDVDVASGEPLFASADKFDSSTGCRSRSQSRLHSP